MRRFTIQWGIAGLVLLSIAGCGGGSSESVVVTPPVSSPVLKAAIDSASAIATNDTAINSSASFTVLQDAGLPAVTINSPLKVNFAVFDHGAVVRGLTSASVGFTIAKLVPGVNGDPDQWVNYVSRKEVATATKGPGVPSAPALSEAWQATTDPTGTLVENSDGYYTYQFRAQIENPKWTEVVKANGVDVTYSTNDVLFEPDKTHRVAFQLSYKNWQGETVIVNPYFDFTFVGGKSVPVTDSTKTRKMTDVASCNGCHEKLAIHGGRRVDTQYCVMCHNPGTTDANSGNNLNLATMVHKIHAGKRLAAAGEDYTIWGYRDGEHAYKDVGFPQDLRNCTVCHSGANPKTPQGDNWKTKPSKEACLTCHASGTGSKWDGYHRSIADQLAGVGQPTKSLTNESCAACHAEGADVAPERVHWNQNEENGAKYKMNIESAVFNDTVNKTGRTVTVKYFLSDPTNGNAAHDLTKSEFSNLRFYLAYQNMIGQLASVTEYSAGSDVRVDAKTGTPVPGELNHYTIEIQLPDDVAQKTQAKGTARVVSIGQVKEPKLDVRTREVVAGTMNVVVQHTFADVAISGSLNPRRVIVSNEKCNVCHGALGTTSGSNTGKENAFHSGARNTVEACAVCHDANKVSTSTTMTNGTTFNESYQFKRMIHGIHGNSKRYYPFTRKNAVQGAFCNPANTSKEAVAACNSALTLGTGVTNFAAEVAWPGVGINCNACHVNNSYKQDLGTLGAVIKVGDDATDPNTWKVISPKAATCTACHDSSAAIGHVSSWGGAAFGNKTQAEIATLPAETCYDACHTSGGSIQPVDLVHGQK